MGFELRKQTGPKDVSFEFREHPRDSHVFKNKISEILNILLTYVSFSLTRKRDEEQ